MYTKYYYNRHPSTANKLNKSRSTQHLLQPNTHRSTHYQTSIHHSNQECLACKHESSNIMEGLPSNNQQTKRLKFLKTPSSEYYKTNDNSELVNVKKSKRFLEELIEQNKGEYKQSLEQYERKLQQVTLELQEKDIRLQQMQTQYNLVVAKHQYSQNHNSLVGTYLHENNEKKDRVQEEKRSIASKNKELRYKLQQLHDEMQVLRTQSLEHKKIAIDLTAKQQKFRQYEIYVRQYESMRMLINKMQYQKEEMIKKQKKQQQQSQLKHQQQMNELKEKNNQLINLIQQKEAFIQSQQRCMLQLKQEVKKVDENQYEKMQELMDDKDDAIEKLQYKIRCIESQINFIKNKYSHLLLISKHNNDYYVQENGSLAEEVSYRGIYNVTNIRQSMLGMNLSPIRRR